MAYDQGLAARTRDVLEGTSGLVEKQMFGGVGFMVHGNMACGILKDDLLVRVSPQEQSQLLQQPHTRVFAMTGRASKGWVLVCPEALASDQDLRQWVERGLGYARSLPAK